MQIHTVFSDGVLTPYEIIEEALLRGVKILAITDHGSIGGISDAMRYGKEAGIYVISGVEFGTGGKRRMDILGYNFNIDKMSFLLDMHDGKRSIAKESASDGLSFSRPYKYIEYVIDLIHLAGGKAVVAHARRKGFSVSNSELLELKALGLDGVEVFYPLHSQYDTQSLLNFARKHSLLITGGTDFHSFDKKPKVQIGDVYVQAKYIEPLLKEP